MLQNKRRLLLMAGCFLLLFTGCADAVEEEVLLQTEDAFVQDGVELVTTQVQRGDFYDEMNFVGSAVYKNSTTLYFEEAPVTFGRFLVEEGEYVTAGQVLAECEVLLSEEEVGEKRREREEIQNTLLQVAECLTREIEQLEKEKKGLKGTELEICNLQIKKKELELQQYKEEAEQRLYTLDHEIAVWEGEKSANQIVAPINGYIDKLAYVKEGEKLEEQRWMIRMHSEDEVYIQVSDKRGDLDCLMPVTVQANGTEFYSGVVVQADNVLGDGLVTQKAYVVLEDKSVVLSELKNIVVIVKKPVLEGTLLVERNAVYTSKGKKYVLLVEDEVTKKRFVTVGPGSNSTICILDGISEGDSVVIR